MSWKASGFVKAIVEGITPAEKLLMLVLADYHNTARAEAWPSLDVLAKESLMSKRNASRVLASLEGRFLKRKVGTGRGNVTSYLFIGLDCEKNEKVDLLATFNKKQKMTQKMTNTEKKVDTTGNAIRKEPRATGSLEPGINESLKTRDEHEHDAGVRKAKALGFVVSEDGKTCHRPPGPVRRLSEVSRA